jgi:methyl-accepting chemotaxis protein
MAQTEAMLAKQALVMGMADTYMTAMGEAVYLLARNEALTPRGRWMAQSFLRNGLGAALDIAAGPNPSVALLDILVLATLQTWSFERHWIPAGIGEAGIPAVDLLERAEANLWNSAAAALSQEKIDTVRRLIDAWIAEHPDQIVVSLVRFEEFADARKLNSLSLRGEATGMLREVTEARGAIDDVRLLGERSLWYASRYPYMLGQQVELTAYRMVDQPEVVEALEAMASMRHLTETIDDRLGSIEEVLVAQQTEFFARVREERARTVEQASESLEAMVRATIDDAAARLAAERRTAIDQAFEGLARERSALLDDVASREGELATVLRDLRDTIAASSTLAHEMTDTVSAIDRVVSRFDEARGDGARPLSIADLRDAAAEIGRAADRMTEVLDQTNTLISSNALDHRIGAITAPAAAIIDRAFVRVLLAIAVLIGGLALVRLIPQQSRQGRSA